MQVKDMIPIPVIEKCKKLLCIQPHPDDMDISAGGTIAYLSEKGTEVSYLTVTDDSSGFTSLNIQRKKRKSIRKDEQINAGRILGVKNYHWLDYTDAGNWSMYKLRNRIIQYIRLIKPDFVMTVDPWLNYEAHQDHVKCGLAASEAVILQSLPYIKTNRRIDRNYSPYEIKGIIFSFTSRPNVVINTEKLREKKFKAIAEHKSQFDKESLNLLFKYDDVRNSRLAKDYDFGYGEGLKVLNPAMLHCIPEAEFA